MQDDPTLPFGETDEPEEWRGVVGYEGDYEVSSLGRVRSIPPKVRRPGRPRIGLLSPAPGPQGYLRVGLSRPGESQRLRMVAHLVMEAFVGPRPDGLVVRHGPGGFLDNRLANLCYGTQAENIRDKERDGTKLFGEAHHQAELTDDAVAECRRRAAAGEGQTKLAREFGVTQGTMHRAITGQGWAHVETAPVAAKKHEVPRDHSGKLTADLVREIRTRHAAGARGCDLADAFRVTRGTVSMIVNRKIWKDVA